MTSILSFSDILDVSKLFDLLKSTCDNIFLTPLSSRALLLNAVDFEKNMAIKFSTSIDRNHDLIDESKQLCFDIQVLQKSWNELRTTQCNQKAAMTITFADASINIKMASSDYNITIPATNLDGPPYPAMMTLIDESGSGVSIRASTFANLIFAHLVVSGTVQIRITKDNTTLELKSNHDFGTMLSASTTNNNNNNNKAKLSKTAPQMNAHPEFSTVIIKHLRSICIHLSSSVDDLIVNINDNNDVIFMASIMRRRKNSKKQMSSSRRMQVCLLRCSQD
jgi:DNA-binding Xre family transcriptional regulator